MLIHGCETAVKPASFLVTIDVEGDNLWTNPRQISTENARFLPRFHNLCEKYGLRPTYLTTYEMASCERFAEFAHDVIRRGTAEIGMHLHAGNTPPVIEAAGGGLPYLIDFPENLMREKVKFMTGLLEERFGVKMVSHRAGRWGFNEIYARTLVDCGYRLDCSVTPNVSWVGQKGLDSGTGGTDYRGFPAEPYFIDPADISKPGSSSLLEVPVTIEADHSLLGRSARRLSRFGPGLLRKAAKRLFPEVRWFRPTGRNLTSMQSLLRQRKNSSHIQFMLHSSELMPGGSPIFRDERSVDVLYEHLEQIFAEARSDYQGATLKEFRDYFDDAAARPRQRAASAGIQQSSRSRP